jgi:hypothetical protein
MTADELSPLIAQAVLTDSIIVSNKNVTYSKPTQQLQTVNSIEIPTPVNNESSSLPSEQYSSNQYTSTPLNYHALVIGIDQYKKISKLKTAVNDAQAVASTLGNDYKFAVKTLINPTRVEIITAVNNYRKLLTSNDALLIYYAGHGWLDKEADEGYWLPVDASEEYVIDGIATSTTITGTLKAMDARHVLVVADSCYSGKLTRGLNVAPKSPSEVTRLQGKKARKIIASGGLEPVTDSNGKEKHSVFASAFLNALKDNNKAMTATDLFSNVRTSVIRNADQTPEYGVIHKAGDDGGDFIFLKHN